MTKAQTIKTYLLENDKQVLNDLIKNKRTQTELAKQFDVSIPLIKQVIVQIEPNFDDLHRNHIYTQLTHLENKMKYGFPLEDLIAYGYVSDLHLNGSEQNIRNLIMSKMRQYGVIKNIGRNYFATPHLVKTILSTLVIDDMYRYGLSHKDIVEQTDVSRSQVTKITRNIDMFERAMPFVPGRLYDSVRQNRDIYKYYLKHDASKTRLKFNLTNEDLDLIVFVMGRYIKDKG